MFKNLNANESCYAFRIADRYLLIQEATEGYEYSFYDSLLNELDGGVYDDLSVSIVEASRILIEELKHPTCLPFLKGRHVNDSEIELLDYESMLEKAELVNSISFVEAYENELRNRIMEFDALNLNEFCVDAAEYIADIIDTYDLQAELVQLAITGIREGEDKKKYLNVVFEFKGNMREDNFFNILHEQDLDFSLEGFLVDFNPIREDKTGTLSDYLKREVVLWTN